MKLSIKAGATSQSVLVFLQNSSVTTGAGLTGLAYNTAGLTAYYSFAGAACESTAITLATLAAVTSAWASAGFKEVDATNLPGVYRFDLPNAVLAAGNGRTVVIYFQGATNLAPLPIEIELTGWDNQDGVHGGMSALPNVASGNNGAIPTTGTGANQIAVNGTGKISEVVLVDTVTTYTGNTPQTGDSFARIGAAGAGLTAVVLAAAGLNNVLIDTVTLPYALKLIGAATAGKCSGAGTGTIVFLGLDGVTVRLTATVDSSGNRDAVVQS